MFFFLDSKNSFRLRVAEFEFFENCIVDIAELKL